MSIGLTAGELADIRADIADLLPDTCTIEQVSTSNDAIGAAARSYSNRATGVSCRLDPVPSVTLTGSEAVSRMKNYIITKGQFVLTLPHDTTIEETDRVIHGGKTYSIKHVDDDKSWQGSVRCVLETIEH